ncbi:MAG: hydantoinase/oxoprolinase N-terminal domain-containing protein, partial [Candidatus Baltobacteraceae bacterium]
MLRRYRNDGDALRRTRREPPGTRAIGTLTPLRVGIDVGGTFTDAVAIDPRAREVVARVKVPTTHTAADGVASGIRESIERLLATGIDPAQIAFVAHS